MNTWNLLCFTVTRRALLGSCTDSPHPRACLGMGQDPPAVGMLNPEPCQLSSAGPEAKCMKIL